VTAGIAHQPDSRFDQENLDAVDAGALVAYDQEAAFGAYEARDTDKAAWGAAYERTQRTLMRVARERRRAA
jgi:hypothetical protein